MKPIETGREPWAGFAASPKSRAGASNQEIAERFTAQGAIAKHLPLVIAAEGIASWLAKAIKFDARLGAKLRFELHPADESSEGEKTVFGGTYISLVIPKNIILTTERHGEISVRLRQRDDLTEFEVTFNSRLLPEEVAEWQQLVESALQRLRTQAAALGQGGSADG